MKIKKEYLNKIQRFENSPDAGTSDCICSLCKKVISEGIAIRFWDKDSKEIRFHEECFQKVIE